MMLLPLQETHTTVTYRKSTYRIQILGVPSTQVFIIDHLGLGILDVTFPSLLSEALSLSPSFGLWMMHKFEARHLVDAFGHR